METTCQICERAIKANTGLVAHHGYKRPGQGWQTGSCPGARALPWQVSCDLLRAHVEVVEAATAKLEVTVESDPESLYLQVERQSYREPNRLPRCESVTAETLAAIMLAHPDFARVHAVTADYGYGKRTPTWSDLVDAWRKRLRSEISQRRSYLAFQGKRLAGWKKAA